MYNTLTQISHILSKSTTFFSYYLQGKQFHLISTFILLIQDIHTSHILFSFIKNQQHAC